MCLHNVIYYTTKPDSMNFFISSRVNFSILFKESLILSNIVLEPVIDT